MKRLLFFVLAYLLGAVSITYAQDQTSVFRVGVLDGERGPISNGARLAVREINEAGGVTGADGTVFRLELVIEAPDNFSRAVNAIDEAGVIAVIGPQTTEEVLGNLPILQQLDAPLLTPALGDTIIATDTTGRLFRIRAPERLLGNALASYLTTERQPQNIVIIQMDVNSTSGRVGFSVALDQIGSEAQETTLLFDSGTTILDLVEQVNTIQPQVTVVYGPPELAAQLYTQLRLNDYNGLFAYSDATSPRFQELVPLTRLQGILSMTTWPLSATDPTSSIFLNNYVRGYGRVPGPIDAASYDAVYLLARAIQQPGELVDNLTNMRDIPGVQGILNPSGLIRGEMSDTVAVVQLNSLGGADVVARYAATERLSPDAIIDANNLTPTVTSTPSGNVIVIRSAVQNVRTGPGLDYEVLGQLRQGEQVDIVGATADFAWVVIDYRGQQGWLATYLLDVYGDRSAVSVVTPPPTPTLIPATATPSPQPFPDIIVTGVSPNIITTGVQTVLNVNVRNVGAFSAGPFAVGLALPPDNIFASAQVAGLAVGIEQTVQIPISLNTGTGIFSTSVVADVNNTLNEGGTGESNNAIFIFTYKVDRQIILIQSNTLNLGTSIDLEGNVTPILDLIFTENGLATQAPCNGTANCIGLLSPALNWDTSHYNAITSANGINLSQIENTLLTPGLVLGVLTAEGRRAVLRVEAISAGSSITFTYRVYQN